MAGDEACGSRICRIGPRGMRPAMHQGRHPCTSDGGGTSASFCAVPSTSTGLMHAAAPNESGGGKRAVFIEHTHRAVERSGGVCRFVWERALRNHRGQGVTRTWKKLYNARFPCHQFGPPNLFAIWLRSSVVSVLFSVTAETSSLMTIQFYCIFGSAVAGLDGLAHTSPHSVVTIAPSVSDATFTCLLCGHRGQIKASAAPQCKRQLALSHGACTVASDEEMNTPRLYHELRHTSQTLHQLAAS